MSSGGGCEERDDADDCKRWRSGMEDGVAGRWTRGMFGNKATGDSVVKSTGPSGSIAD